MTISPISSERKGAVMFDHHTLKLLKVTLIDILGTRGRTASCQPHTDIKMFNMLVSRCTFSRYRVR